MKIDYQPFFFKIQNNDDDDDENDNKMTKTCEKTGGRETLKDGIVSKLQRHIVWQQKLLIVIHLFSSWFMTND